MKPTIQKPFEQAVSVGTDTTPAFVASGGTWTPIKRPKM